MPLQKYYIAAFMMIAMLMSIQAHAENGRLTVQSFVDYGPSNLVGAPLPGVNISIASCYNCNDQIASGVTGSDGTISFSLPPSATYRVSSKPPKRPGDWVSEPSSIDSVIVSQGTTSELQLDFQTSLPAPHSALKSGTVKISVALDSGDPVPGAIVSIYRLRSEPCPDTPKEFCLTNPGQRPDRVVTVNSQGLASIRLPAGNYAVLTTLPAGYGQYSPPTGSLDVMARTSTNLDLEPMLPPPPP